MLLLQAHEPARLSALAECGIVGSPREGAFDELVAIARKRFDAPIAAVSFVDERALVAQGDLGLRALLVAARGDLLPLHRGRPTSCSSSVTRATTAASPSRRS